MRADRAVRWLAGRHLPGTLLVCVGSLCARATVALVLSSALVYLIQPVIGSVFMALLFLGSAVAGRPITLRLARDFIALPVHLLQHRGVRRVFTQIAALWGFGRLIDAAHEPGLAAFRRDGRDTVPRSLSGLLTALMIGICAAWGVRSLRRLPDVSFRFGRARVHGYR